MNEAGAASEEGGSPRQEGQRAGGRGMGACRGWGDVGGGRDGGMEWIYESGVQRGAQMTK